MKLEDVQDLNDKFLVSIQHNKNEYPGQFVIGNLFYNKVKHYISLRPTEPFTDRFFIQYSKGKCTRQVIGKNKIREVPQIIASYLKLPNPKKYTGQNWNPQVQDQMPLSNAPINTTPNQTESNYNLLWSDFEEEFTTNDSNPTPGKHKKY